MTDRLILPAHERDRRLHHLATGAIGAGVDYVVITPGMLAAAMNEPHRQRMTDDLDG